MADCWNTSNEWIAGTELVWHSWGVTLDDAALFLHSRTWWPIGVLRFFGEGDPDDVGAVGTDFLLLNKVKKGTPGTSSLA